MMCPNISRYDVSGNYDALKQLEVAYKHAGPDSFALYLGAGVNLSPPEWNYSHIKNYRTRDWKQLIEALYEKNKNEIAIPFQELWKTYKNDWPSLASKLVEPVGEETLVEQIDSIIHEGIPRGDKYGRLTKRLLDQAPTLHAALCFSTEIQKRTKTSWTFKRNPKIGTIITPNYDFFFGAGWTRYQSFKKHWKVQTPFSREEPNRNQRTINYIHGYVPYKFTKKKDLVLTNESYKKYYKLNEFAYQTLWNVITQYNIIFIGTSFTDKPLCRMLKKHSSKRKHYAIVKNTDKRFNELGIRTVLVHCYSEIAKVLGQIYCTSLDMEKCRSVGLNSPHAYWERLMLGPVKSRKKINARTAE